MPCDLKKRHGLGTTSQPSNIESRLKNRPFLILDIEERKQENTLYLTEYVEHESSKKSSSVFNMV